MVSNYEKILQLLYEIKFGKTLIQSEGDKNIIPAVDQNAQVDKFQRVARLIRTAVEFNSEKIAALPGSAQHKPLLRRIAQETHECLLSYLKEIDELPASERVDYLKQVVDEITSSLSIFELTRIFQVPISGSLLSEDAFSISQVEKLKEILASRLEMIKQEQQLENNSNTDISFEFSSNAEVIAWMYHLGVLEPIYKSMCDTNGVCNITKMAKVVASFALVKEENARKLLQAIYTPSDSNKHNNPLRNKKTEAYIHLKQVELGLKKG